MSSRNTIPPRQSGLTVVAGWDNPLRTWVGCAPGEILRAEDLGQPLAPYAELSDAHLAKLRVDRAADADRAPSPLQRAMLARLGRRR